MIKKFLSTLFTIAVVLLVLPLTAFADNEGFLVKVHLTGTYSGVTNAVVNVTCGGVTQLAVFQGGTYNTTFTNPACTNGSAIVVTATYGQSSATINDAITNRGTGATNVFLQLDGPIAQVPEFGLVTGAMALLTSGGSLFAYRRFRAKAQ